MQLRGHRVVVKADVPGERIGSIIIPERARMQPLTGTVVLIGHKVTSVVIGERVMFGSMAWSRWQPLGFPYMLLKEEDVWCVLS